STFLMSFAKSLPRLASTRAFLCFVVAHLECPAMGLDLLHDVEEECMHARVGGQLRMKRRRQQRSVADRDDPTGVGSITPRRRAGVPRGNPSEHLHVRTDLFQIGSASCREREQTAVAPG